MAGVDKPHIFTVGPTEFTRYDKSVRSNSKRNPISVEGFAKPFLDREEGSGREPSKSLESLKFFAKNPFSFVDLSPKFRNFLSIGRKKKESGDFFALTVINWPTATSDQRSSSTIGPLVLPINDHLLQTIGEYLGLTGARLDGAEMLACGLATHFVSSKGLPLLEEALFKVETANPNIVSAIIDEFSQCAPSKEKSAFHRLDTIDRCFSKRTVEEILSALGKEAAKGPDEWITKTIQSLKKASPISLKVSLRSIREGRLQSVSQCLIREYRMCCHIFRGEVSKDFFEGCRAILLDKDKNPKWEPSKLELVNEEMVDQYFSKVDDEEWKNLKLPIRSDLAVSAIAKL